MRSPESKEWRQRIVNAAVKHDIKLAPDRGGYRELAGLERTIRYAMSQSDHEAAINHVIELAVALDYQETYASNEPDLIAANTVAQRIAKEWYFIQYYQIATAARSICEVLGGDET